MIRLDECEMRKTCFELIHEDKELGSRRIDLKAMEEEQIHRMKVATSGERFGLSVTCKEGVVREINT